MQYKVLRTNQKRVGNRNVILTAGQVVEGNAVNGQNIIVNKEGAVFSLVLGQDIIATEQTGGTTNQSPKKPFRVSNRISKRGPNGDVVLSKGEVIEGTLIGSQFTGVVTFVRNGVTFNLKVGKDVSPLTITQSMGTTNQEEIIVDSNGGILGTTKSSDTPTESEKATISTPESFGQSGNIAMVQKTLDIKKAVAYTVGGATVGALAGLGIAKLMKKTTGKTQLIFAVVGGLTLATGAFVFVKYKK